MDDIKNNPETMDDLMNELETSLKRINVGDVVKGKVIAVTIDEMMVDIQFRSDGIVTKEEALLETDLVNTFKPGQVIDVQILKIDDGSGNVILSQKRAGEIVVWEEIEKAYEEGSLISATVSEVVKGGLVAKLKGIRAFIPASHIDSKYVEDLNEYMGKTFDFNVIEFEKSKNKLVFSRKELLKKEKDEARKKILSTIEIGNIFEGKVNRLVKYGAFVDIGGIDGLVHVSEMSWRRVNHPSEILAENDLVEVEVIGIDKESEKISLKLTKIEENPWDDINEYYEEDDVVEAEITRLANFGAFAKLEEGIEGLIHISKISEERIANPSEKLAVGDKVEVLILEIDKDKQKISLSIKDVREEVEIIEDEEDKTESSVMEDLFGEKLKDLFK